MIKLFDTTENYIQFEYEGPDGKTVTQADEEWDEWAWDEFIQSLNKNTGAILMRKTAYNRYFSSPVGFVGGATFDSFSDFWQQLRGGYDGYIFFDDAGALVIRAMHHDGLDTFIIKKLSPEGIEMTQSEDYSEDRNHHDRLETMTKNFFN